MICPMVTMPSVTLRPARAVAAGDACRSGARCLIEARPAVLAAFLLRYLASGALVHGAYRAAPARVIGGAFAWEAAIFSIYLFNGVMDVEEDRINGSRRPIARGALPAGVAVRVAACAAAVALATSIVLGGGLVWPVTAVLAIGFLYSGPPLSLKRRVSGTTAVGVSLGLLTYWAGACEHTSTSRHFPGVTWLVFVVTMSLWMGLVGVPAKDLSDIEGDRAAGRRTVPVIFGESRAHVVIAAAAVLVGAAFAAAGSLLSASLVIPAVVLSGGAVAVATVSASRFSLGDRRSRRRPYRAFMITQFAVPLSLLVLL
jgi:4-hydroxybenzoate polyprenyltransferase